MKKPGGYRPSQPPKNPVPPGRRSTMSGLETWDPDAGLHSSSTGSWRLTVYDDGLSALYAAPSENGRAMLMGVKDKEAPEDQPPTFLGTFRGEPKIPILSFCQTRNLRGGRDGAVLVDGDKQLWLRDGIGFYENVTPAQFYDRVRDRGPMLGGSVFDRETMDTIADLLELGTRVVVTTEHDWGLDCSAQVSIAPSKPLPEMTDEELDSLEYSRRPLLDGSKRSFRIHSEARKQVDERLSFASKRMADLQFLLDSVSEEKARRAKIKED